MGISAAEKSLYKVAYAEEKALKAKEASDHLSVWKNGYDQDIYIYIYIQPWP